MYQIQWNNVIYAEFVNNAVLTDEELKVLKCRVKGYSRVKTAEKCKMSDSNVDKIIRRIRDKYDSAQEYSALLPPRKKSKREKIKQGV